MFQIPRRSEESGLGAAAAAAADGDGASADDDNSVDKCTICLSEYEDDEDVRYVCGAFVIAQRVLQLNCVA